IMGESKWMGKRWEEMDTDVLVKIFKELNLVELSPVSQVCRLWRLACSDPLIWGTLDFGLLKSNFIQTRASPYIWVDDRSDKRLAKILRVAMAISRGNVNCMIFHYNLYMKDEHLHYISQRQCVACQRMMLDEGILRWYRYEDWFWRRDEVRSLDLKDYGRLFGAQCEMLTSVD
uniref:F-box domain-containing protein n=1 Tax=Aegilops tauschii subsp. strangulata TaxID=200361 RepID=A0A452YJS6_AEGTS